mmetsp:Transcript_31659/g.72249  ORF Transcript_31659/g.72249 Transcript_31659/m.72249 type:complete len:166 (+) Transcript_31659:2052-2549(+)
MDVEPPWYAWDDKDTVLANTTAPVVDKLFTRATLRTDNVEPIFAKSSKDKAELRRQKLRTDKDAPMFVAPKSDVVLPRRATLNREKCEPMRDTVLRETVEPNSTQLNIENFPPNLWKLLTDSVEPKVTISIMDKDEAKRDAPKTATQLPSLENDRTDSELPTFAL